MEGICTGTIRNESITSKPELGESTKYTDQINVSIKADVVGESTIKEKKCYYGKSTNNINNPEDGLDVVDNECVFENLEDNTDYYVKVCMTTEKNSRVCSATKNIKTYEVQKPTIKKPSASINIEFDDSNIREGTASHYLYSTISGTVDKDVYKCDLIDDVFNCDNSSTTTIDGGIWYKTNDKKINIEYLENEAMSPVIEAQTRDGSNNKAETSYEIHKVNIIFNTNFSTDKGMIQETTVYEGSEYNEGELFLWRTDSDGVIYRKYDGIDNDYTKYFFSIDEGNKIKDSGLPNYNNKYYMKITQEGYSATSEAEWICIGGDCKIGDTYNHNNKSYTSNVFCKTSEEDCTAILGVNWQLNKVYIKFDVNGGTIEQDTSDNSRSYTWATNNDGIIERTLNGKTTDTFFSIDYNSTGNLPNYNNDKYINVTKSGYIAAENNEWKCLSSDICGNNTYNHTVDYSADAFCDNISEKNCEVTLGVNWQAKIYSIEYDLAGGSVSGDGNPNSYTIESNDITLKNPTKAGYTFTGWKGSNGTTPSKTVTISKGSTGNKSYTANWADKVSGVRYYTESKSPFFCDKFYITSCSIVNGKEQCNYNEKNNITSSGTVMRNVLALDISVSKCGRTYYVNASSGINCYKTPSYNANVIETFGKCFAVSGGEISLTNNNSQGSGWYYSIGYDCYFPGGTNISDTLPSSCTSTQSGPCGKCVSNKDCESNRCVTDGCANSDGSYNCCSYSSNSSDIPALCN